jgi:hypothetical protein
MSTYVAPHRPQPYGAILAATTPVPEPKPVPSAYIPVDRGDLFDVLKWLRAEVYPGLVGHDLDDEGIAAWVCDNYTRYRQAGVSHQDAKHRVFADIERVVHPPVPPVTPPAGPFSGPIGVRGRDFVTP